MMFRMKNILVVCCVGIVLLTPNVYGEHEDDGICICSECPDVECEAEVSPRCHDILAGHHLECTDGMPDLECQEFTCAGDDGEDAPDLCNEFCAALNCTGNTTLTCESNLEFPCFHEDTLIQYNGEKYTMEDFVNNNEPECRVPHFVTSVGVVITTSCGGAPLRLTDDHLVYTTDGVLLEAVNLKNGDILSSNYDHSLTQNDCYVESVVKEKSPQKYFGLNCLTSEVLAGGIHSSTFGSYHTIPAIYMYNVGTILGIDVASQLGDYLSILYSKVVA
jgi:hypothetical protein